MHDSVWLRMDWWQETERQRVRPDQINNGITYVKCQRISPPVPLIHKKKKIIKHPKTLKFLSMLESNHARRTSPWEVREWHRHRTESRSRNCSPWSSRLIPALQLFSGASIPKSPLSHHQAEQNTSVFLSLSCPGTTAFCFCVLLRLLEKRDAAAAAVARPGC